MKILVTGGSGFIGSHVVDRVLAGGHEARNFDLIVSPYLNGHPFENALGDLRDEDAVRAAVSGCDVVIHLAAMADVDQVAKDPTRTEQVNARGTHVLLEAARQAGVSRFVYASTIWVYGDATGPELIDEDTPLPLPKHFYTATKIAGEMYVRSYGELYVPRAHDPPLRHSVRASRTADGGRSGVCRQGARRAAADDRRRRHPVEALRLRRGSRCRGRGGAAARGRESGLQPRRQRERQRPLDRENRAGRRGRRADRACRGPRRRPSRREHLGQPRPCRTRLGADDDVLRRRPPLRRTG